MKRLFDENSHYTQEATHIDCMTSDRIRGIIEDCDKRGICLRDLSYVMKAALDSTILEKMLGWDKPVKPLDKTEEVCEDVNNGSVYDDKNECVEEGRHLTSCDDDGYCNFCGEQ